MDALEVVLDDVLLGALVAHGRLLADAVAAAAEGRHVAGERGRVRVVAGERPVGAVAVVALGRVRAALREELTVLALAVLLDRLRMADRAVDARAHRLAGTGRVRGVAAGVALNAGDAGMPRLRELVLVREEGHRRRASRHLQIGLAVAAEAVLIRHALRVVDLPHPVGRVAVHAGRDRVRRLLPELPADDLAVNGLDLGVALSAGLRHVLLGDRGPGIGVRKDEVSRVAARADRGHGQALLEEALTVDRVPVVGEDVRLGDLPRQADGRALLVAAAAEPRDFDRRGARAGRARASDVVRAVAALAPRGLAVARGRLPTMDARGELLGLLGVATAAVDRREPLRVGNFLDVGVAGRTVEAGVRRRLERRRVERRRLARLAPSGAHARLVAGGAVVVLGCRRLGGRLRCRRLLRPEGEREGERREPQDGRAAAKPHAVPGSGASGPGFFAWRRSSSSGCSSSISRSDIVPFSQAMFIG